MKEQNRKSTMTGNMNFPRQTTAFGANKTHSDIRPIKDATFQADCHLKILGFLIGENYEKKTNSKELSNPTTKEFTSIFSFIYSKIRPDAQIIINRVEDDLPFYLNELRYPGYLSRSHLAAVCVPNMWPHFIALLSWMVELANYMNFEETNLEEETPPDSEFNLLNPNEMLEKDFNLFLYEGFKQTLIKNDCSTAVEIFNNKIEDINKAALLQNERIQEIIKEHENNIEELNLLHQQVKETEMVLKEHRNLLDIKTKENKDCENHVEKLIKDLESILNTFDKKDNKIKELNEAIAKLETTISNQKVSYEEFERMKNAKVNQEKQYQTQRERNKELNDLYNDTVKRKEELLNIREEINSTHAFIERKNLPIEYGVDIAAFLDNPSTLDKETITSLYQENVSLIQRDISEKSNEFKEKEVEHLNFQKDILQLDNDINEILTTASNLEKEIESKNFYFAQEKERLNLLLLAKNDEFIKLSESITRNNELLNENGKKLEDLQNEELVKKQKVEIAEMEACDRIAEAEDDYLRIMQMAKDSKSDGVKLIRKGYKTLEKIFLALKSDLNI
jgi:kinetochore protein NDC80